jgi:Ca2+-binding EF-hand superfamily protein
MSYFKKFDRDGTGNLDKNEFESALKALGFKITT